MIRVYRIVNKARLFGAKDFASPKRNTSHSFADSFDRGVKGIQADCLSSSLILNMSSAQPEQVCILKEL